MVDAIPLVTEYNKGKLLGRAADSVPDPRLIQLALVIQYCHALRISEVLDLSYSDFNFDRKILTLHRTKTGFKKVDGQKVRNKQYTSIPPDFKERFHTELDRKIFSFNRQGWTELRKSILREDPAVLGTLDNVCRALVREFT